MYRTQTKAAKPERPPPAKGIDSTPLDEEEQLRILEQLISEAQRQGNNARAAFYYVFLLITGIYSSCLFYSQLHPLDMDHEKVLSHVVSAPFFSVFYLISIICSTSAAVLVKVSSVV